MWVNCSSNLPAFYLKAKKEAVAKAANS